MILHNATILTMDEVLPRSAALAIAGGRILGGVDSREDVIASHAHERFDLQGATVVPGFVDAHVHFRHWALARTRVSLTRATSLEQLLQLVQRHGEEAGAAGSRDANDGGWVLGHGWRDEIVPRGQVVHEQLDQAAAGVPIALTSKDGHAMLATPRALEAAGVSADDLELPGGVVERDAEGRFTGVLREASAWELRRRIPERGPDTRTMAAAMREASRRGVTAVHDMDGAEGFRSWHALETERGLALRVWQNFLADELEHLSALGIGANFGGDRIRIGGIKVFADGTLGSGTAWLHEPEQQPGDGGSAVAVAPREAVVITGRDELERIAGAAADARLPLLVHAIGDAAATAVLDALEATHERWRSFAMQPRIEHAQLMRPGDIERAAQLGVALSVQPTHLLDDRPVAEARWGDRTRDAYAYRSMLDAGCQVLFGSDAPIEELSPLAALRAAIERALPGEQAWHPEQRISPEEALRASTAASAEAVGMGASLGQLSPGYAADLVVLSGNPLTEAIDGIEVVATMVGGRWTYGATNLR